MKNNNNKDLYDVDSSKWVCMHGKIIHKNIAEVINYNVSKPDNEIYENRNDIEKCREIAIEMMIDDVVENVIRFVDKIDKPEIDYIRKLLQNNNYEIMTCVDIMEQEEKEWKESNEQIPEKIREIMEYGYTKEKAINSMIEDIRLMTREHQWEVCRCEYWKPLPKEDIQELLKRNDWDVMKCVKMLKSRSIQECLER